MCVRARASLCVRLLELLDVGIHFYFCQESTVHTATANVDYQIKRYHITPKTSSNLYYFFQLFKLHLI